MKLEDSTPLFGRIIVPWYDSITACIITFLLMDLVFLFGAAGAGLALFPGEYADHVWVPGTLMFLSGTVMFSIALRLIRRLSYGKKRDDEMM